MSKMPAKKKSCFQITSVTPAQVAAAGAADDTESLEDPDESRAEDVSSSDMFDVSRADLEPGSCCRSSSEETVNGAAEAVVAARAPANGGFVSHVPAACGDGAPAAPLGAGVAQQSPANVTACTSQPAPAPPHAGCSSRFRVIKLDHGSGEPFRRGRWTCTEFYERDSEATARSVVDSVRHGGVPEHAAARDSGLGTTGGSVPGGHSAHGPDAAGDASFAMHAHPADTQHGYGGFNPPGYSAIPAAPQVGTLPPQSLIAPGHNGVQQAQKSPVAPQAQSFTYPNQHLPSLMGAAAHGDYRQPHLTGSTTPIPHAASLPVGSAVNQGPSPVLTPGATGPHTLGLVGQSGEVLVGSGGGTIPPIQGLPPQPVASSAGVHTVPGIPHVPTTGSPLTVPSVTPPATGQPFQGQPQVGPGGTGAGAGLQGLPGGVGQVPVTPSEENRRKSEVLPQPPVVSGKDVPKPLIAEGLQLAAPSVNSLFGVTIAMDGDVDRNPSTAFYQAFPPSKSRDSKAPCRSASGASVVAIDNKIEQAMDLVKSHLMYAVREEVEVLKEQIKELCERNSVLERENAVLKSLASNDQLSQLSVQLTPPQAPQEVAQQPNISSA
ncbi:hypothetical protein Z043-112010 [Arapaima gigas]